MLTRSDTRLYLTLGIVFLVLIGAPYVYAYLQNGSDHVFGGFLLNPIDGNSYLAKMYQGWSGSWLSRLPYTSQPGDGAYLFLSYLTLGHLARITGFSLQLMFHLARLIGSLSLLVAIYFYYKRVLITQRSQWLAFGLALFGSGLGWLATIFGKFTADLWVAEGYPFLSAYANPHFPFGMAIMIFALTPRSVLVTEVQEKSKFHSPILLFFLSIILALILPFGVIVAGTVLGGLVIWEIWDRISNNRKISWSSNHVLRILKDSEPAKKLIFLCLGGLPILFYQVWIVQSDPVFAIWNSQNLTVSPPLWDLLVSFAPVLFLGLLGIWFIRREMDARFRVLVLWAILGSLLIYLPFGLQRRFLLGYLIPLAGLAGLALDYMIRNRRRFGIIVTALILILAVPSNVMIILGGIQAINAHNPNIYLTLGEIEALEWIEANTPPNSVILASPEMGLYIPAYTGRRVLYGHPFETINAEKMEAMVLLLLEEGDDGNESSPTDNIDYLFFGPRERELVVLSNQKESKVVFSSEGTQIFQYID